MSARMKFLGLAAAMVSIAGNSGPFNVSAIPGKTGLFVFEGEEDLPGEATAAAQAFAAGQYVHPAPMSNPDHSAPDQYDDIAKFLRKLESYLRNDGKLDSAEQMDLAKDLPHLLHLEDELANLTSKLGGGMLDKLKSLGGLFSKMFGGK